MDCKKINLEGLIYDVSLDIYDIIQEIHKIYRLDYRQREELECVLRRIIEEAGIKLKGLSIKKGNKTKIDITICENKKEVERIVFNALKIFKLNWEIIKSTKKFVNIEYNQCAHVYIIVDDFIYSYCCRLRDREPVLKAVKNNY